MHNRPQPQHFGTSRRGISLIELMISLMITAGLLVATAVAVNASFTAYSVNQQHADVMQRARTTLHRVTTLIRTNKAHAPLTPALVTSFAGGYAVTDSQMEMYTLDDTLLALRHDAEARILYLSQDGTERPLLRYVDAFSIRMEPMRSQTSLRTGAGYDLLYRATVTLSVSAPPDATDVDEAHAPARVDLTASVIPRRNVW